MLKLVVLWLFYGYSLRHFLYFLRSTMDVGLDLPCSLRIGGHRYLICYVSIFPWNIFSFISISIKTYIRNKTYFVVKNKELPHQVKPTCVWVPITRAISRVIMGGEFENK
jgi:hypothetical protein